MGRPLKLLFILTYWNNAIIRPYAVQNPDLRIHLGRFMDDDIWDSAAYRAERAEHKTGMTPYRRGVARILSNSVEQAIRAKLGETRTAV
jgi:hypothetical protein